MTLRLNLGQYLKDHGISAYRLVQEVQGSVAPNTVYALARRPAQRIDLGTVAKILQALGRMRGEPVRLDDVLAESAPEGGADVGADIDAEAAGSAPGTLDAPLYEAGQRKVFRYGGYRAHVAPGPSVQDLLDELRGHAG